MKTRNRKVKNEAQETFIVGEPEEAPASTEQTNGNKARERFQLSFDLNEDGTPDLSTMRGRTKEKVRQFFSDPRMAAEFGAKAAVPEVQIFHPAMVGGLYDMLGSIEATVAQRYGKIPPHVAKQVFTYTPAEKNALEGPTVRVLNKYAADWMIKYQDEIALGTILISLTVAKVNACITLSKMQNANTVEANVEPAATPQPN